MLLVLRLASILRLFALPTTTQVTPSMRPWNIFQVSTSRVCR
uniref:Uncharacterized protein n=1 Tax=Anguilla anguilla TaxID=7936 RepID=A0A0E9P9G3_ANGAN